MSKKIVVERLDGNLQWVYRDEIKDVGNEGKDQKPFIDIFRPSGVVSRLYLSDEEDTVPIYEFWGDGHDEH